MEIVQKKLVQMDELFYFRWILSGEISSCEIKWGNPNGGLAKGASWAQKGPFRGISAASPRL